MVALVISLLVLQDLPCREEAAARMPSAVSRVEAFDLAGAAALYAAAGSGCADAEISALYLRGLVAATEAYRQGGSPQSLEPVTRAVAALDALGAQTRPGPSQIARFVLLAAAAASQSERDEMALLLDHAIRLEALQLTAGQPGAPAVTAHEIAGDLWLQVHRYEDARSAYLRAEARLGRTPRVTLGLARVAMQMNEAASACREYAALLESWGSREEQPSAIVEARRVLQEPACL